jgi:hypothetical protein
MYPLMKKSDLKIIEEKFQLEIYHSFSCKRLSIKNQNTWHYLARNTSYFYK